MTHDGGTTISSHPVVSREEWLSARKAFLAKEKEFTRLRDDLNRRRRELPWVKVDTPYDFERTNPGPPEREGLSVFYRDEHGTVFHTYSCYARGIDMLNGTYQFLDLVPKGRDEDSLKAPQAWVQYHDRYEP